jgi:putative ABC transport system substrate-binding protein
VRRREFITLLGGAAAAWALAARAQQPMPVVGFMSARAPGDASVSPLMAAFRRGLGETGHVEARNMVIEYYRRPHSSSGMGLGSARVYCSDATKMR